MTSNQASVVKVRLNGKERRLLEAAAERRNTTLTEFVRRAALDAAECDWLEQRAIKIPATDWEAFETWAYRAGREIPSLTRLAATDIALKKRPSDSEA